MGDDAVKAQTVEPRAVLRELRRTRTARRVQKLEWFEAAYNAYLAAIAAALVLYGASGLVGDEGVSAQGLSDFERIAPHVVGLFVAAWVAIGLRSGSQGGPVSLEDADVRHVLMAPIPRVLALRGSVVRYLRHVAFLGAAVGAVAGQLAGRRLGEPLAPWIGCGALAGSAGALAGSSAALLAHEFRLPRWAATLVGIVLVGWQASALAIDVPGPADGYGHLLLWPLEVSWSGVFAIAGTVVLLTVALFGAGRLSVEQLLRRSGLVAQLRFAVTLQDIRTVTLLRRQLSMEQARAHPWIQVSPSGRWPVWRRGWQSIARFPIRRVLRMLAFTAISAVSLSFAFTTARALIFVAAAASLIAGLEALEPLSEELDRPDRTDQLPVTRTYLFSRHLAVPAVVMLTLGLIGALGVIVAWRTTEAVLVAIPMAVAWAAGGLAGAALNAVAGAPDPLSNAGQDLLLPPEVVGLREAFRIVKPVALAVIGCLPVVAASATHEAGRQVVPVATRASLASVLFAGFVLWYVTRRDDLRARWRAFTTNSTGATS